MHSDLTTEIKETFTAAAIFVNHSLFTNIKRKT